MPGPMSNDLRKSIIEAKARGDTNKKIAQEKAVNVSTVERLLALYRATGSYEPLPLNGGRKPRLTATQLEAVRQRIIEQPNITLLKLIDELALPVCKSTLCRNINNKLGLRHKKNSARGRVKS